MLYQHLNIRGANWIISVPDLLYPAGIGTRVGMGAYLKIRKALGVDPS